MNQVRITQDLDIPQLTLGEWRGRQCYGWVTAEGGFMPYSPDLAGTNINPVAHPLAAPAIVGTDITVDLMLQQPTRITSFLMDITLQRFVLDRLFTSAGGVSGGAVVYDMATENELYLERDVEAVAVASEFPVVTSARRVPSVAEVEKWGGKYWFSYEARDRNDAVAFRNENVRLGNTMVRKLNARAVSVVDAAITANAGLSEFVGHDWSAAIPGGAAPTPPNATPAADFAQAQLLADQRELGIRYNIALVNPVQLNELRLFYQDRLDAMLADNGFDEVYATNRIAIGTAYFVAEGQLGEMRVEQPLATETWQENQNQRFWVQSSVRPVMFVRNPFAVVRATGL